MQYSFPYLLLILSLGLLSLLYCDFKEAGLKQRANIIAISIFVFFFGFRGYIMSDFITYYPYFESCTFDYLKYYSITTSDYWEPGFTLLNLVCKGIYNNFFFFQFVCFSIVFALLLRFFIGIARIENLALALMLYTTFEGLVISTNLLRNGIAIMIFLNALPYIQQRRPLPYFALCTLAITFHLTSVIFLPLYFFFHRNCNRWVFLGIFLLCNFVFLAHIPIAVSLASLAGLGENIVTKVSAYTEHFASSTGISIGYLERLLTGGLIFLYFDHLKEIRKDNAIYINGIIAYFVMYFCLSQFEVMSKRFATLFAFGYWVIWTDLIKAFAIENNRKLFRMFIVMYCVLRMAGTAFLPDFKYENILLGNQSTYEQRKIYHNRNFDE